MNSQNRVLRTCRKREAGGHPRGRESSTWQERFQRSLRDGRGPPIRSAGTASREARGWPPGATRSGHGRPPKATTPRKKERKQTGEDRSPACPGDGPTAAAHKAPVSTGTPHSPTAGSDGAAFCCDVYGRRPSSNWEPPRKTCVNGPSLPEVPAPRLSSYSFGVAPWLSRKPAHGEMGPVLRPGVKPRPALPACPSHLHPGWA